MHTIRMPGATDAMEDGTVLRWHKAEGEAVEVGELLVEIEAVDSTVEVQSGLAGTLRKILLAAGRSAAADSPIALIGDAAEDLAEALAELDKPAREPKEKEPAMDAAGKSRRKKAGKGGKGRKKAQQADKQPPAAAVGKVIPIVMPQAGQSMEEGTIVAWRVRPGDAVEVGQVIFDVETDKATIEVEAVDAGRLAKVVLAEGETIEVKRPVAYLADSDADVEAYLAAQADAAPAEAAPVEAPASAAPPVAEAASRPPVGRRGRPKASPAARKLAASRGVDLAAAGRGSGPGGRILAADVAGATAAASGPVRHKMTGMRKAIAHNLLHSKQTIPHFYARLTIDADRMYAFYREQKAQYSCTLNDVVTLACGRVIREFPVFRSRLDGDGLIEFPTANIGIAVGLEDGLVVPVVVGVGRMGLKELAAEARRLIDNARAGKVEGVGQGVFTITNLGMFGVEEFAAIINPPEAAILGVGALREGVQVRDGAMRAARVMTVTLSVDHRVIDGVMAAHFLARLKEILEDPGQLA